MAEITKAAIGRRAAELAEKDGFAWRIEFIPPGSKIDLRRVLDDDRRQEYLDQARRELEEEAGNS